MRPEKLRKLIEQDESAYLEYKSTLNLRDKAGKAKFLKEVLSLANSLQGRAYLVIGVQEKDKKKNIVGMEDVGEEQVQQVIAEWCRPAIGFSFEIVLLEKKNIGVITIYASRPPHTVKKRFGYQEADESSKRPKQKNLEERDVFVRRGSTIDKASVDEIIEMAQRDRDGLDEVVSRLDRIADWQEETAEAIYSQNRHIRDANRSDAWFAVPIFIALITGALIGWQGQAIPSTLYWAVSGVISVFIFVSFATFKVINFTFKQAVFTIVILALFFLGLGMFYPYLAVMQTPLLAAVQLSLISAIIGGLFVSIVTIF